jgi:hypothetical protein
LGRHPAEAKVHLHEYVTPISMPMYTASPAKHLAINKQMDKWIKQDIIEPSVSPWGAPVVIAYRNGKPRFCVDYWKLNTLTIPDKFPLPWQAEIMQALSGSQVLSTLDALSGFTQLSLAKEDKEKTAFRTHRGLYQFKRMPFGLCNGPSIFQRVMHGILAPYLWIFTLVYIDDIVVFSKSYEEHLDHLDKVLSAVIEAHITLSPPKCHFLYLSILLLGQKVSRLGLSTHKEKVEAILTLTHPHHISDLCTFLGMAIYFSHYIPYYSDMAAPLFQLLGKARKWTSEAEHKKAFEEIKAVLASAPVLAHPLPGLPYRLYADASDLAIGVTLQQVQPITVRDLKGTRLYTTLERAYEMKGPIPTIITKISKKINDIPGQAEWGSYTSNE